LKTIGYFAVVAIIGAIIAARALTKPIQVLVKGTCSIASGDLTVRLPVNSSDELGVLADSFNRMADSLQTRTQELMEANQAATIASRNACKKGAGAAYICNAQAHADLPRVEA
jgi:nitrogen fixation/metabolism regulation signal transduction histidine kinase